MLLRQQMSQNAVKSSEDRLLASLHTVLQSRSPCTVGLFYPTRGEPNLLSVCGFSDLTAFTWALPVCVDSEAGPLLHFAKYSNGDELVAGRYNIPVPAARNWVQPDVLVIPCVAYHRGGARLGYGAGWYDRTLANLTGLAMTIGIAYSATETTVFFAEPHDRLLDLIITETEVITARSGPVSPK